MEPLHNMKSVSVRTGLSAHLIRVWEKRYGAVEPARSQSQRRLYSESEVERLSLLGVLTRQGLSIGQIARLTTDQLRSMAATAEKEGVKTVLPVQVQESNVDQVMQDLVQECIFASRRYDLAHLERTLDKAMVTFGASGVLERVLVVLLRSLGDEWDAGRFTAAQEHFASSAIRDYLAKSIRPMVSTENAPRVLVCTPSGQLHELGAIIACGIARKAGWNVTYLGPSLPADEIAGACLANNVRALALSIIYPPDDSALITELVRLRNLTPAHVAIVVGGNLGFYRETLQSVGAIEAAQLRDFSGILQRLRTEPATHNSEVDQNDRLSFELAQQQPRLAVGSRQ